MFIVIVVVLSIERRLEFLRSFWRWVWYEVAGLGERREPFQPRLIDLGRRVVLLSFPDRPVTQHALFLIGSLANRSAHPCLERR